MIVRSSRVRALALAAAGLFGLVGASCNKAQLAEAVVPDEGVSLRYDLTPGQAYGGHVKSRTTIQTPMGNLETRMEFDVDLFVTGANSADGPLMSATISNITVKAITPGGIPAAQAGADPEVAKALDGLEFRFNMSEAGKIENMPEPPEDQPMPFVAMIGQLTEGLTFSLASLPDEPLKKGETWTRSRDEDSIKSTLNGTFKDFGTAADGLTLAKLETEGKGEGESERQGMKLAFSVYSTSEVSFATDAGYPTTVYRKVRQSISNFGDVNSEYDSEWTKLDKRPVEATAPPEVQAVTDPCDADYVGPDPCPADGAGEEQAITDPCDADYVGPDPCPADEAPAPKAE